MTQSLPHANNIPMPGFYNLRDGGDLPTTAGGKLKSLRLLRSDEPTQIDPQALKFFQGLPLNLVIDLRTEEEVEMAPDPYQTSGFKVDHLPIFGGSAKSMMEDIPSLEALYTKMVEESGKQLAQAVAAVSEGVKGGAVVVHCTAGKDRTGVVIALVQTLLGVPRQDVVDNYTATQSNLDGAWFEQTMNQYSKMANLTPAKLQEAMTSSGIDVASLKEIATGSPAKAIEGVLDYVDSKFGGAKEYLTANGLTNPQIEALENALVESE